MRGHRDPFIHTLLIIWADAGGGQWGSAPTSVAGAQVRGVLMPARGSTQRTAAGAGIPVPSYEAFLPYDPALSIPGWHIEHEGQSYYPTADARDEGGQGLVLVVPLSAPGQVVAGG